MNNERLVTALRGSATAALMLMSCDSVGATCATDETERYTQCCACEEGYMNCGELLPNPSYSGETCEWQTSQPDPQATCLGQVPTAGGSEYTNFGWGADKWDDNPIHSVYPCIWDADLSSCHTANASYGVNADSSKCLREPWEPWGVEAQETR